MRLSWVFVIQSWICMLVVEWIYHNRCKMMKSCAGCNMHRRLETHFCTVCHFVPNESHPLISNRKVFFMGNSFFSTFSLTWAYVIINMDKIGTKAYSAIGTWLPVRLVPYPVVCWGSYSPDAVHCLVWLQFVLFLHLTGTDQAISSSQFKLTIWPTDIDKRERQKYERKLLHHKWI